MYVLKGGSYLSNEQSVFRFDLNESLYFEKGQEVAEIMGISLDPEISIQEFNDYISIRGVVELQGSYQKAQTLGDLEADNSYVDGYESKRYMERVTDTQYGGAEFMHRFPVEITVPSYRVNDVDEVTVSISEFDYELPESNHLYLRSTIEIYGINNQVEDQAESGSVTSEQQEAFTRGSDDSFEFEVKNSEESSPYIEEPEAALPSFPVEEQVEETESERWKFMQQSQTFDAFFKKPKEPAVEELVEEENFESSSFVEDDEDFSLSESKDRKEDADLTYLADIFQGGEEQYTKLKVRIVQERDTLETLAEQYETSTLQIRNQNQLEDDDLTKGQLLYIPVKK